jgi:hypothetical protein
MGEENASTPRLGEVINDVTNDAAHVDDVTENAAQGDEITNNNVSPDDVNEERMAYRKAAARLRAHLMSKDVVQQNILPAGPRDDFKVGYIILFPPYLSSYITIKGI